MRYKQLTEAELRVLTAKSMDPSILREILGENTDLRTIRRHDFEVLIQQYESKERQRAEDLMASRAQQSTNSPTSIWVRFSDAAQLVGDSLVSLYSRRSRLDTPPGYRLNSLAEFVYSKKTYERVFLPLIADVQTEYNEALHQGRWRKAQYIRWRGRAAFWTAVFARVPVAFAAWVKTALKSAG